MTKPHYIKAVKEARARELNMLRSTLEDEEGYVEKKVEVPLDPDKLLKLILKYEE